jgi:hypothetical protein
MVRPTAARRCADCARKKKKCLHVDEEQDDQLVCKIGSEKKRKIQKPSQFVPTEERPPSTVCPRTAKRRQIEKLYTLDEVKVMLEEGVKDMVGKLQVKLQAKQKMLRKAHNKLATQAKFMAARAELSTKQSGIKTISLPLQLYQKIQLLMRMGRSRGRALKAMRHCQTRH